MFEAQDVIMSVCDLSVAPEGECWLWVQVCPLLTKVIIQTGRECREWAQGAVEFWIQDLIHHLIP